MSDPLNSGGETVFDATEVPPSPLRCSAATAGKPSHGGGKQACEDTTVIYSVEIDECLRTVFLVDPAKLDRALEEAGKSSARARREAVEKLVRPEPEDDYPRDPLSDAVCRHFGMTPDEFDIFYMLLYADPDRRRRLPGADKGV